MSESIPYPDLYLVSPILGTVILILLMLVMVEMYLKMRRFLPIIVVYLFSLIIGMTSLSEGNIPFTPWFQLFFLMFQSAIFIMVSIDLYNDNRS